MNVRKKNPAGILLTIILCAALLTICLELGLNYLRPDTPGSIPKHLIHFAIMFALLGCAVLLCLFCPPFKKLWAWIDEHILSQETRPIAIDIIYAIIAGIMLLHHFYVLLYYPAIPAGATKLAPVWIILATLTVILNKSWRDIGFRFGAIFLIYTFERLYFKSLIITKNYSVYFISAIYAICICYSVISSLRSSLWKPFLQTICLFGSLATLILSLVGLYTAWTGICITNFANETIYVDDGRLSLFSEATISASILSCGSIITLIGFAVSKHKLIKILYLLICFVTLIANALTDARASLIMLAFMLAGTLCIGLWGIVRNAIIIKKTPFRTVLVVLSLILCFGFCFYGAVEGQRYLGTRFIEIRDNGGFLLSANAEEQTDNIATTTPQPPDFKQRDVWISDERMLTGRYYIWQNGIQYIQTHPDVLLFGLSIDGTAASVVDRPDHTHNILLQTLLEGGIPALLLYLLLLFCFVFHTFRLWNRRGIPFWQRILPLPVFSIFLWEMAECLTHFSYGHPPMTLFWFFLGATITVSKSLGKAPKAKEIPATNPITETGE